MSARSMICRLAVCLALLPAAAAAQLDKIPWAKGPTKGVLGAEATITVPASCLFTGMDGVKAFLSDAKQCVRQRAWGPVVSGEWDQRHLVRALFL